MKDYIVAHPVKVIDSGYILYFKTNEQARSYCLSYDGVYIMHEVYVQKNEIEFQIFDI